MHHNHTQIPNQTPHANPAQGFGSFRAVGANESETCAMGLSSPKQVARGSKSATEPFEITERDRHENRVKRLRRTVLNAAGKISEHQTFRGRRARVAFVTLTYKPGETCEPRDIQLTLKRMREWGRRRGAKLPYVWVMELTKAGVPHFHICVWLPRGLTLPKFDKQGWWSKGMTNIQWGKNGGKSAIGYVAKYLSKGVSADQLDYIQREKDRYKSELCDFENPTPQAPNLGIPKGMRIFGTSALRFYGDWGIQASRFVRYWNLPKWLRESISPEWQDHDFRPCPGGGYVCFDTGQFEISPWLVTFDSGRILVSPRL